jgi:SNF2 family DNA or RNA helicase
MKAEGMNHQLEALRLMNGKEIFALFHEQGCGKTWTFMADAERLYASGEIDAAIVFAPKGVHTNWVRTEIPKHMDVPVLARAWRSGAGKREMKNIEKVIKGSSNDVKPLRILSMNIDAVNTQKGLEFAKDFLCSARGALGILDESGRIKNPTAARTRAIHSLRPHMTFARIGTGTPITRSPIDVFSQMEFLQSGLLGTSSYRAFVAEYSELMDASHPMMQHMIAKNPRIAHAQIQRRDEHGNPVWRNLDKLQKLIAAYSHRVLKKDCMDLPSKIYKTVYFELTPTQRRAYDLMANEYRLQINDDTVAFIPLATRTKLQQITSGYVLPERGAEPHYVSDKNPRLELLRDVAKDIDGKFIVWAIFQEELSEIARALRADGLKVVEYHGRISDNERLKALDAFQDGDADVFVAHPKAGGIGLTLTAAEVNVYYSNSYDFEDRAQSEDRTHRKGTRNNVLYIDLAAIDTVDENITRNLQRKDEVASMVLDGVAPQKRWEHRDPPPKQKPTPSNVVDAKLLDLFEQESK